MLHGKCERASVHGREERYAPAAERCQVALQATTSRVLPESAAAVPNEAGSSNRTVLKLQTTNQCAHMLTRELHAE
jgi:hypothetical protein